MAGNDQDGAADRLPPGGREMKLRTKICLVCVAAMLILSQSFSLFMLHLSQKDQLERISKYEYSIFENKV